MNQPASLSQPWYKQLFFILLVVSSLISALLIFAFWIDGWSIWLLGLLLIAAWMPLVFSNMRKIFPLSAGLAMLYIMVMFQGAHTIEHLAQMYELHILGLPAPKAQGIISFLNIEWVHLIWNTWVLAMVGWLLFIYPRSFLLWALFIFAIYHEAEHVYMVSLYIKTGIPGNPGLLARGGLIGGGLPIARPDLHAIYAVFEEAMILMIYFIERGKVRPASIRTAKSVSVSAG